MLQLQIVVKIHVLAINLIKSVAYKMWRLQLILACARGAVINMSGNVAINSQVDSLRAHRYYISFVIGANWTIARMSPEDLPLQCTQMIYYNIITHKKHWIPE